MTEADQISLGSAVVLPIFTTPAGWTIPSQGAGRDLTYRIMFRPTDTPEEMRDDETTSELRLSGDELKLFTSSACRLVTIHLSQYPLEELFFLSPRYLRWSYSPDVNLSSTKKHSWAMVNTRSRVSDVTPFHVSADDSFTVIPLYPPSEPSLRVKLALYLGFKMTWQRSVSCTRNRPHSLRLAVCSVG
jgi:hypothetical protein